MKFPKLKMKELPAPLWVLGFGFLIFGPLMALAPRFMPGAIIYAAIAMAPPVFKDWKALREFVVRPFVGIAALTIVYTALTAFWSPSPKAARFALDVGYVGLCALVLAAEISLVPKKAKQLYLLFFSCSLLAGFFVLAAEFLLSHPVNRWFNGLSMTDPISENVIKRQVALFSLLIWPTAAWLEQVRSRIWAIAALLGFAGFSMLSTSRSGALGMLAGMAVMTAAWFAPKITRWTLMGLVVCGLVFVVPVSLNLLNLPKQVEENLFSSANHRVKIWYYTAHHVLEKPIFGHGIDSSGHTLTTTGPEGMPNIPPGTRVISAHPHNVFLQFWMDFGLVGVILWGALLLKLVHALGALPREIQPYALGAFTCSMAMLSTTYTPLQAWWAAGHVATALMLILVAQNLSSKR
jgi:exopolysaccharide production protein ExoQ